MAAADNQNRRYKTAVDPIRKLVAITKSDTVDIDEVSRGLFSNGYGTLRVLLAEMTSPVDIVVNEGQLYPLEIKRVYSTGSAAINLFAAY